MRELSAKTKIDENSARPQSSRRCRYAPDEQKVHTNYVLLICTISHSPVPVLAHTSTNAGNEELPVSGNPKEDGMEKMEHWLQLLKIATRRSSSEKSSIQPEEPYIFLKCQFRLNTLDPPF